MAISVFSRYASDAVSAVTGTDGITRPTIIITPPESAATYNISLYTWQQEDQIDYLAYSAYRDETQWWRIADANPEILFWDSVKAGSVVRVPNA
ncbi:MAG TPA: hypothetical protein VGF75_01900 [Candidatus Saccharimonadales bacterium]|jgi:hypothetical protein